MHTNTDPVRALIGEWRNTAENGVFTGGAGPDIRETLRECAVELEAAIASAPPRATVGVEVGLLRWVKAQADDPDANPRFRELYSALAQQPATVSALDVFRIAGGDTECDPNPTPERALEVLRDLRACYDEALSQQPAAPSGEAGQWVSCCPALLIAGVSCARTPRREGSDGRSHEHFIAHAAPQQPAGVDEAMVERALAAYLRRQEDGESLYGCVTAALTAALAAQQQGDA